MQAYTYITLRLFGLLRHWTYTRTPGRERESNSAAGRLGKRGLACDVEAAALSSR
jgi:hypothetical protein